MSSDDRNAAIEALTRAAIYERPDSMGFVRADAEAFVDALLVYVRAEVEAEYGARISELEETCLVLGAAVLSLEEGWVGSARSDLVTAIRKLAERIAAERGERETDPSGDES